MARKPVGGIGKAGPRTVRFLPDLDAYLVLEGAKHADGMSGVLNEALELYRKKKSKRC